MTETPIKPKRTWKVTKRSLLDRIAELKSALSDACDRVAELNEELRVAKKERDDARGAVWALLAGAVAMLVVVVGVLLA